MSVPLAHFYHHVLWVTAEEDKAMRKALDFFFGASDFKQSNGESFKDSITPAPPGAGATHYLENCAIEVHKNELYGSFYPIVISLGLGGNRGKAIVNEGVGATVVHECCHVYDVISDALSPGEDSDLAKGECRAYHTSFLVHTGNKFVKLAQASLRKVGSKT